MGIDGLRSTSAISTAGLVPIRTMDFVTASSVSLDGVFTSAYDNYRLLVNITAASTDLSIGQRLRVGGVDSSTGYYYGSTQVRASDGNTVGDAGNNATSLSAIGAQSGTQTHLVLDLVAPALTSYTKFTYSGVTSAGGIYYARNGSGLHTVSTSYDGYSLIASAGTITGNVTVYGYSKTPVNLFDSPAPGLVPITAQTFSTATTVSVNNCFTSAYDNYFVAFDALAVNTTLTLRLRAAGVDESTASYYGGGIGYLSTTVTLNLANNSTSSWTLGYGNNTAAFRAARTFTFFAPNLAQRTQYSSVGVTANTDNSGLGVNTTGGLYNATTQYDGFSIISSAASALTGTVRVYGYN